MSYCRLITRALCLHRTWIAIHLPQQALYRLLESQSITTGAAHLAIQGLIVTKRVNIIANPAQPKMLAQMAIPDLKLGLI